jgi:hypothetical protein
MIKIIFIAIQLLLLQNLWAQNSPRDVRILNVALSGSGCDMENVAVSLSPEATDVSLLFDSYLAEVGPSSLNPNQKTMIKNCQITMDVLVPMGWQMAIRSVDYRGFASVPEIGATAFHRFTVMQTGALIVSLREATLVGPFNDDYYVKSEIKPERLTWSKCFSESRTQIHLMSQLGVRANPRASRPEQIMIALDSSDVSYQQNMGVEWRICPSNGRPPGTPPGRPNPPRFPDPRRPR